MSDRNRKFNRFYRNKKSQKDKKEGEDESSSGSGSTSNLMISKDEKNYSYVISHYEAELRRTYKGAAEALISMRVSDESREESHRRGLIMASRQISGRYGGDDAI